MTDGVRMGAGGTGARRSFWLKHLHRWHWISSALCLVGMLLFAITGITLNHADLFTTEPVVTTRSAQLPPALLGQLPAEAPAETPLPAAVADWAEEALGLNASGVAAEWSQEEVYVALPRAGGDAWLRFDRATGAVESELTDRGWISWFNDLHKGRNTGTAWFWFIDVFAIACIVFTVTGLFLLQLHGRTRPSTWPLVGLGLLVPLVLALLFIH